MITVGMNYQIIPGKDDEFVKVFTKVLEIMGKMEGHDKTNLFRDVHSEHDYLIVSEWSCKHAFDAFMASDQFKNVADWGKLNVLRGRPTHEIYGGESLDTKPEPTPAPAEAPAAGKCPMGHG